MPSQPAIKYNDSLHMKYWLRTQVYIHVLCMARENELMMSLDAVVLEAIGLRQQTRVCSTSSLFLPPFNV